jgi:hypothetical protein
VIEAAIGEPAEVLGRPAGDVDAELAHGAHGVGMQGLGMASGARGFGRAVGEVFDERLRHLRASAVSRAQEQDPRPRTAQGPRMRP